MYRKNLIKAIIKNSFEYDTAYIANGWGNLVSVIFYMLSTILFIDVIFQNVESIAGYSRNEILLFNFLSQIWAFLLMNIFFKNFQIFIQSVNTGELDLILTKPVPILFYLFFRQISIIGMLRDFIPGIIILTLTIEWGNLNIEINNLLIGLVVMILGLICSVGLHFIATLPVFFFGESQGIMDLFIEIDDRSGHTNFVYEAWSDFWKTIFTVIFPTAISTALTTSVMLGKSSGLQLLPIILMVTVAMIILLNVLWKISLRNYSSASS